MLPIQQIPAPAGAYGGTMSRPRVIVVHSAETPLGSGRAAAIAHGFSAVSAHYAVDPGAIVQAVPTSHEAYHVGPNANSFTVGIEQSGYAAFTLEEWTTPDGLAQLHNLADLIRSLCSQFEIPAVHLSDADLKAGKSGIVMHLQITATLGGTTHTDPGADYPIDQLIAAVNGTQPTPEPDPDPEAPTGGFLMALTDQQQSDLAAAAAQANWGVNDTTSGLRTMVAQLSSRLSDTFMLQGQDGGKPTRPGRLVLAGRLVGGAMATPATWQAWAALGVDQRIVPAAQYDLLIAHLQGDPATAPEPAAVS